jgi:hypothetical protein
VTAAAETATVAIDPTLLALLPISGVLLTIVAGLIGAAIQRSGERAKWIRERRLEAYRDFLVVTDEFFARGIASDVYVEPPPKLVAEALRASGVVHLLGPDAVYAKAKAFQDAVKMSLKHDGVIDELEDDRIAKRREYIATSRAALK